MSIQDALQGKFMKQALALAGAGQFQPAQPRPRGQMTAGPMGAMGALGALGAPTPQAPLQNLGGGLYQIPQASNPTPNLGAFGNLPAAQGVQGFYPQGPMGGIALPQGAPSQEQVIDFFSVNMGRKPTAYEIEYYTNAGGKKSRSINRWQQLIADTGKYRSSPNPVTTGWEGPKGGTPLDMSQYAIQALQGLL